MRSRFSRHHVSPKSRPPAQASLQLQEPPERLAALLREHGLLLKQIRQKKKDFDHLLERTNELGQGLARAQPLADEGARLDGEIHALFAGLLSRKRQPRDARRMVAALYHMLQDIGVLSYRDPSDNGWHEQADGSGTDADTGAGAGPFDGGADGHGWSPPPGAGGFSARRPGGEPANQSLRGLFRDLATALHPDKVHDEDEKARRTEAMKEISLAYQDGDLARLLELKRFWLAGGAATTDGDEIDRRTANLERTNSALRTQLKDLSQDLRELRRSPPARMLKEVRRWARDGGGQDPIAAMMAGAQAELDRARELRDCVLSFRDGTINLDAFMRGPPSMRTEQPGDANGNEDDDIVALVESLIGSPIELPNRPRGRGRRQAKRGARWGDVPF